MQMNEENKELLLQPKTDSFSDTAKQKTPKKTGLLGGTFNPVHLGHLILAQNALEEAGLDEVLFIPSGVSYMKALSEVLPTKHRVAMTGLAIEDNPRFALSLLEVQREGNSYSYETVWQLKKANPSDRYFFIVGADTLFAMENWKCPEKLFREASILAASREGRTTRELDRQIAYLCEKYGADIQLICDAQFDISSSQIRGNIQKGKSIRYFVPDKVEAYIKKHHLYNIQ